MTSGFQTNGGGKAELCSLWECLWLGATPVERRGRLPYQSQLTPGNALHPPPHNLTNIKSRHGTKTPPISSAVRAPLSAHFILQGFLLFLSFVPLFLSGWLMAPTRSTVIDWHWLGWRWIIPRNAPDRYPSPATLANPYIETAQAQVAHFVCRTHRPRDHWLLLPF